MIRTAEIAAYLDDVLDTVSTPDFPNAVNGLQFANRGQVSKIAACVDFSSRAVAGAIEHSADMLLVHHGMFWNSPRPIVGPVYRRLSELVEHDICVYSSHLPLDKHPQFGNNVLLSERLGLVPTGDFGAYKSISVGLRGECDLPTREIVARARRFAHEHGGEVITTPLSDDRRSSSWAMVTGAGASADTMAEAVAAGIDTLIVGEGPHWTAVDAADMGIAIIYAGHYATETLGVMALSQHLSDRFDLEWVMIHAPTGL